MQTTPTIRYRTVKTQLLQSFQAEGHTQRRAMAQISQLTHITDQALKDLWQLHQMPKSCALVATGGYGRQELFPRNWFCSTMPR